MMHPHRLIEERFRRLIVLGVVVLTLGWIVWVVTISDQISHAFGRTNHLPVMLTLGALLVTLTVVAGFLALQVMALYNPAGRLHALLTATLPRAVEGRARLERWSWWAADLILILSPVVALYSMSVRQFLETGRMTTADYNLSFAVTLTLVTASVLAAVRMPARWALIYVVALETVRFIAFVSLNPTVLPDAVLVAGNALIYGLVAFVMITFIRSAAASLDRRITATTNSLLEVTSMVGQEVTVTEMDHVVERTVLGSLRTTAAAVTPQEQEAAKTAAVTSLKALNRLGAASLDRRLAPMSQADLLDRLADQISKLAPLVTLDAEPAQDSHLPRIAYDHLIYGVSRLVSLAHAGSTSAHHLRLSSAGDLTWRSVTLHLTRDYPAIDVLLGGLQEVHQAMLALPGGNMAVAQEEGQCSITLMWREHSEHVELTREVMRSDVHDEVSGQFKLVHVLPTRQSRYLALIPISLILLSFFLLAVASWGLFISPSFNGISFLTTMTLFILGIYASFAGDGHSRIGRAPIVLASSTAVLLVTTSLLNLRDQSLLAVESQWWQGTAALCIMMWLAIAASPRTAVVVALVSMGVLGVWGALTGHTPSILGSGFQTLVTLVVTAWMVSWARTQMEAAALVRRRRRVIYLEYTHARAAREASRDYVAYIDSLVRPFLTQQVSGFPLTFATRQRAEHLAAQLHDGLRAPGFRGTAVACAARDARARGVTVEFHDDGGLQTSPADVRDRAVMLTVHALDAMVDGSVDIRIGGPDAAVLIEIFSIPSQGEPRLTEIFDDASVTYDGVFVRAPEVVG